MHSLDRSDIRYNRDVLNLIFFILSNDTNDTFQCRCHKGCSDWSGRYKDGQSDDSLFDQYELCCLMSSRVAGCVRADAGHGNSCSVTQTVRRVWPRCLSLISAPAPVVARARSLWLQKAVNKLSSAAAENFFQYAWNEVVQPKPMVSAGQVGLKKKSLNPHVDCHLFNMKFYIFQWHISFSIVHLA